MNTTKPANTSPPTVSHKRPGYTLRQLVLYFARLGTLGFGGPVALAGYMRRDLVEGAATGSPRPTTRKALRSRN